MANWYVTTAVGAISNITGVVKGQYGNTFTIYVVDDVGAAVDISSYTGTRSVILRSPDGRKTLTLAGTLVGGGTGGGLSFAPASGDLTYAGDWEGQVSLAKTGVVAYTQPFKFTVAKRVA